MQSEPGKKVIRKLHHRRNSKTKAGERHQSGQPLERICFFLLFFPREVPLATGVLFLALFACPRLLMRALRAAAAKPLLWLRIQAGSSASGCHCTSHAHPYLAPPAPTSYHSGPSSLRSSLLAARLCSHHTGKRRTRHHDALVKPSAAVILRTGCGSVQPLCTHTSIGSHLVGNKINPAAVARSAPPSSTLPVPMFSNTCHTHRRTHHPPPRVPPRRAPPPSCAPRRCVTQPATGATRERPRGGQTPARLVSARSHPCCRLRSPA